jgi:hypothetical protein
LADRDVEAKCSRQGNNSKHPSHCGPRAPLVLWQSRFNIVAPKCTALRHIKISISMRLNRVCVYRLVGWWKFFTGGCPNRGEADIAGFWGGMFGWRVIRTCSRGPRQRLI